MFLQFMLQIEYLTCISKMSAEFFVFFFFYILRAMAIDRLLDHLKITVLNSHYTIRKDI